jgi:hypothetical protein
MTGAKVIELRAGRSRHFVPITSLASGFELGLTIHVIRGISRALENRYVIERQFGRAGMVTV